MSWGRCPACEGDHLPGSWAWLCPWYVSQGAIRTCEDCGLIPKRFDLTRNEPRHLQILYVEQPVNYDGTSSR